MSSVDTGSDSLLEQFLSLNSTFLELSVDESLSDRSESHFCVKVLSLLLSASMIFQSNRVF
jgi:hypothetical protein